ncbi:MAG: MFS transporter [Flavobacteriales bacterium]|nr:MFS transporter [Flavobacteriales bacterium]|tara:strand:+ start:2079 stop:3341 length:1263 start_codon:yes stop_codon:yes gene_type:complete
MKNKQAITLLFISNIISGFAQGISMIAIPWYFVDIVARPSVFAYFYLIITFLTLFWGLYAGTIIDRYSRKKVFIYTNLVCGSVIALVSYYGFRFNNVPDFLVLLVFGLTIFNYNIHYPNLYAFGQEITEKKNYGKLNSYIEVQGQVTSMFAGAFAAILLSGTSSDSFTIAGINISLPFTIEAWPIQKVFLMDAITYFIGIVLFLFIKYIPIVKEDIHVGSLFSRLKGGFQYLRSHPSIFAFGTLSYMLFAFTLVQVHVLLPSYVERFMNQSANIYASAEVYYSLGAIFSGILVYRLLNKYSEYLSIVLLMFIVSIAFIGMSFSNNIVLFFTANLILGITNAGVRILRTTYLFSNVPNNLIGRAGSVFSSINVIIRMILILIFSMPFFLIEDNIRWGYFVGALLVLITLLLLLYYYKQEGD